MKGWITLIFIPVFVFALQPNSIKTHILFSGEPILALKAIQQSFHAAGYKLDVHTFSMEDSTGEIGGTAVGLKPFSIGMLRENVQEEGMALTRASTEQGVLKLVLDAANGAWSAPQIGSDEGAELKRSSNPQWFRIQGGQVLRFEPPYVGKWYPEIALLDASMRVLYAYRSAKATEEFELEVPEGACYLKVSNVWGMKVLKEGTWIESVTPGR